MELSRKPCRICLDESEFNASIFGSFCQRTNMKNKIIFCSKIEIKETDVLNTICYKCAANIERYYDFMMFVNKSQNKFATPLVRPVVETVNRRHVTSYVREQVFDADYSFSFLAMPEEKKKKPSNPYFSYFSPPTAESEFDHVWKAPKHVDGDSSPSIKKPLKPKTPRRNSRDMFASQSQDAEEPEPRSLDWRLTPDDSIMKRIREKCFGRSDF